MGEECITCGAGAIRRDHTDWCEEVRAALREERLPLNHGVGEGSLYRYQKGCRCPECTAANTARGRLYRSQAKPSHP